jgi:anti-anti-sigma factor
LALQIAVYDMGAQKVIELTGEADLATLTQLDEAIHTALRHNQQSVPVAIDLAGLEFLDCGTIGVLVTGRTYAETLGIEYLVRNPHGLVALVLRVTGTLDYLTGSPPPSASTDDPTQR